MRLAVNLFNLQNARRRVCLLITCSFPCVSYLWGEAAGAQTPDFNCILLQQINLTDGPGLTVVHKLNAKEIVRNVNLKKSVD